MPLDTTSYSASRPDEQRKCADGLAIVSRILSVIASRTQRSLPCAKSHLCAHAITRQMFRGILSSVGVERYTIPKHKSSYVSKYTNV